MPRTVRPANGRRLREFPFIARLHRRFGKTGLSVRRGIGDDAAVIRPSADQDLVITTDLLIEHIHFDLATASVEDVGYKAAVANLSDIAAMGGTPQYLLIAIAIPASHAQAEIERLYHGLMHACREHDVALVGGDTSASRQDLFLSVTMIGQVHRDHALTRDGARAGDFLYVTGTLGDSCAGLQILRDRHGRAVSGRRLPRPSRDLAYLIQRHLRPTARIHEGRFLSRHRFATAALDLSDGLSGDVSHLCEKSGVGAEIEAGALPVSSACFAYAVGCGADPVDLALAGGEDYELLFTVSSKKRAELDRLARRNGYALTCIGTVRPKDFGLRLRAPDGRLRRIRVSSYQHFQDAPDRA